MSQRDERGHGSKGVERYRVETDGKTGGEEEDLDKEEKRCENKVWSLTTPSLVLQH